MADYTEMIEVDPKLFITCRLCLEEMGVYQILPTVQRQIKYCFDIHVSPFDGLPQLLCKKCKVLLDDYSADKKKFVDKQEALITKLKVKQVNKIESPESTHSNEEHSSRTKSDSPNNTLTKVNNIESLDNGHSDNEHSSTNNPSTKEDDPVSLQPPSLQQANDLASDSDENLRKYNLNKVKTSSKKRARIMSNSSLDSEKSIVPKKKLLKNSKPKWLKQYCRRFVCNICTKTYKSRNKMFKHMYDHTYLRNKYKYIFNKPCRVTLSRVDNKYNSTDLNNTVVYDSDTIFQDAGNQLYHILYNKRDSDVCSKKTMKRKSVESSDEEIIVTKKNKRKSRRISRSSNETVIIADASKRSESIDGETLEPHSKTPENKVTECINIDDSSDESNTETVKLVNPEKPEEITVEYNKTIENIITNCRLKYTKKLESSKYGNTEFESQLKHKLLSIGRKNIHKDGHFNCTGLLRYMEHKNLDVIWLPKEQDKASRENLVRIMTKLKSASENDNTVDKNGWINVAEIESDKTASVLKTVSPLNTVCISDTSICNAAPTAVLSLSSNSATTTNTFRTSTTTPVADLDSAMLYKNPDTDLNSQKLLNQNPVSNPKQLPKKIPNAVEAKLINISSINVIDTTTNKSVVINLDDEQNGESGLIMPIITSTTSLAEVPNDNKEDKKSDSEKTQSKTVPRIKVKPVSELMNPPNNINENHNGLWPMNRFENGLTPTANPGMGNLYFQVVPQIQTVQSLQLPTVERSIGMVVGRVTSDAANVSRPEYILLNSAELPNTRTDSPFKYCKDLLLLHNIFLLDPTVSISQEYISLLKIKVQFKQENKDKPVALCISLYCLKNSFCVCIKNSNNVDIPMTKISAKWQWEIIKLFQGEVSNKILENSVKAGQVVYLNTKTFLCLLKSITCVQ